MAFDVRKIIFLNRSYPSRRVLFPIAQTTTWRSRCDCSDRRRSHQECIGSFFSNILRFVARAISSARRRTKHKIPKSKMIQKERAKIGQESRGILVDKYGGRLAAFAAFCGSLLINSSRNIKPFAPYCFEKINSCVFIEFIPSGKPHIRKDSKHIRFIFSEQLLCTFKAIGHQDFRARPHCQEAMLVI